MGLLIDGVWRQDADDARMRKDGRFERPQTRFRNFVTPDGSPGPSGSGGFTAEAGRYHLYVSLACPWAHRTMILRRLKKLDGVISTSIVAPYMGPEGWTFDGDGSTGDPVNGAKRLSEIYLAADRNYSGRVSVPVLWDNQRRTIVSNKSSEIIRMLNSAFDTFSNDRTDYYPPALRSEIDRVNTLVFENINNGVYRTGFARSQEAYEEAFHALFGALDTVERRLSDHRYLVSNTLTNPTGGCSRRWCGSTRSTTAISSAICAASSTTPTSPTTFAISIRWRASPRPSTSIKSSATTMAATDISTRPVSYR